MLALVWHNKSSLIHINHKFSVSAGFYSKRAKTHCHLSLPNETEDDSGNHVGCITKWLLTAYVVKLGKKYANPLLHGDGPYLQAADTSRISPTKVRGTYRVIIWECILNKHPVRISIDRHNKTLYTVRTPKVGHFICDTKRFDISNGWLTELDQSCTPLCKMTQLGSTLDVFGYYPQV